MDFFYFIPPQLYHTVFILLISGLCLITSIYYSFSNDNKCIYTKSNLGLAFSIVLSILIIWFLGPRPVHIAFVDTGYYVFGYNNVIEGYKNFSLTEEWIWHNFEFFCKDIGLTAQHFLFLVELLYVGLALLVSLKLFPNHTLIAILFFLSSFSFYAYGVNGIRNGLACHIVLLAVALISGKMWEKVLSAVLLFIAYGIHRSTALPILCLLSSFFLIRSTKTAIFFWVISIFISLIAGNFIGNFFNELDLYEDKSDYFIEADISDTTASFSSTGFRFDFLIYSMFPVLMAWYLTVKRNFQDLTYNIIANTYILANAFWIMVIRATFSNRFAYLSWFLYPLVIVYPLLKMRIWDNQDKWMAGILFIYAAFVFLMTFVYYG